MTSPLLAKELDLKDRNVIITGASRGIGKAIAIALAHQGCRIALLARNMATLQTVAAECYAAGAPFVVEIVCDLMDDVSLNAAFEQIKSTLGTKIHILINNAGIGSSGHVMKARWEDWNRVINMNIRSVMHVTKLTLPLMLVCEQGTIINISSLASRVYLKHTADYAASKSALVGFSRSLFQDVRDDNIKVSCINPGYVETDMVAKVPYDHEKFIRVEDVAHTVVFVCKFPQSACPLEIDLHTQHDLQSIL